MWQQIKSEAEITNEQIVVYLERNPVSSIVDFEEEEDEEFEGEPTIINKYVAKNNKDKTVAFIECDSHLVNTKEPIAM